MVIAAFEFLDTDSYYEYLFDSDPDAGTSFSDKFEELGMEHHLTMNNLGTLGFITALLLPLHILTTCMGYCRCSKFCR